MNEDKGKIIFSWQAYEFKEKELKNDWYWALGIIALAGSVASFIFGNFLFGIFIIIASILIFIFSKKKPRFTTYEITENGVLYEGTFYFYENLKSFWIEEADKNDKKLLIKSDRLVVPILTLPYDKDETGEKIFESLSDTLPYEPLQEPFGHMIMDRLGF